MRKIVIIIVCILFFYNSKAQEKAGKSNLGINAGFTTGMGISYEYWPGKNGFQLTFLPLFSKDLKKYSLGFTYLRNLTTENKVNLIAFFGNNLTNFYSTDRVSNNPRPTYNIGIGPGLRGGFSSFVYQFMVGYAIADVFDDYSTSLSVEFGLFYQF